MAADRHSIDDPLVIDLSRLSAPPLKLLLQQDYRPAGVVQTNPDGGATASLFPWYTELGYRLTGTDATLVLYVVPFDDDTNLLAACIDDTFEALFRAMSGADFGNPMTDLVARDWPDVYEMLRASQGVAVRGRSLCVVGTAGRLQWVVADPLRGAARTDGVTNEQLLDLMGTALKTMLDSAEFVLKLPGSLQVLGGPDRTSRRLTALAGLFKSAADFGGTFTDGVQVDELKDMAEALVDFGKGLRDLKD